MQIRFLPILTVCVSATLMFSVSGCGSGDEKYRPSEARAKEALNAALKAWQDGQAHGTVSTYSVPIDPYDARWQAGETLEKFEVVRNEKVNDHNAFIVRMKLTDEKEEQEVTYIVIGNDPLMVFRKQDYDKVSGVGGG